MRKQLVSLVGCALVAATPFAHAQTQGDATPIDPSWTAYSLKTQCQGAGAASEQCVGAVRGIIHGYQYGVLFLGREANVDSARIRSVSLCLNGVPVQSIVNEYLSDVQQVSDDSLRKTSAETAVLGSVHMHHACN